MQKLATEQYVISGSKKLRCGITTGSCAAIAAMAATEALLTKKFPSYSKIITPKGWYAAAEILEGEFIDENSARCAVQKDAGDDPDATDGILIFVKVCLKKSTCDSQKNTVVRITGGKGVGTVTKSGLDQKAGEFAINSVPRKMITESVQKACSEHGFFGEAEIQIEVPEGEKIAKQTFNPILGIEGGISILGTTGVVEPMSENALIESIEVEIKFLAENFTGKSSVRPIILTPGNYGTDFISTYSELKNIPVEKCSNFIGKAIEFSLFYGFTHILLVGHAGKFVKLAGGIMNTHSHNADCRLELIAAHAALCGVEQFDIARIFSSATVDAALEILDESNMTSAVTKSLLKASQKRLAHFTQGKCKLGILMFTNDRGIIGETSNFSYIIEEIKKTLP